MKNTTGLKPWQPGQSGNPSGRPKIPKELQAIRSLSQIEVAKIVSKYAHMSQTEVAVLLKDPLLPMIEAAVASIFAHAVARGDYARLSILLDRAVGKVPQFEPESPEDSAAMKRLQGLSVQELVAIVEKPLTNTGETE